MGKRHIELNGRVIRIEWKIKHEIKMNKFIGIYVQYFHRQLYTFPETFPKSTRTGPFALTEWKKPEQFHLFSVLKFDRYFWFELDPGYSRTDWADFLDIPDE